MQNLLARAQLAVERARALSVEVSQAVCSDQSSMHQSVECPETSTPNLVLPARVHNGGSHLPKSSASLVPHPAVKRGGSEMAASSRSTRYQNNSLDLPQTLESNSPQELIGRGGSTLYYPPKEAQCSGRTNAEHLPHMILLSSLHEALAPAEQALHQVAVTQRR